MGTSPPNPPLRPTERGTSGGEGSEGSGGAERETFRRGGERSFRRERVELAGTAFVQEGVAGIITVWCHECGHHVRWGSRSASRLSSARAVAAPALPPAGRTATPATTFLRRSRSATRPRSVKHGAGKFLAATSSTAMSSTAYPAGVDATARPHGHSVRARLRQGAGRGIEKVLPQVPAVRSGREGYSSAGFKLAPPEQFDALVARVPSAGIGRRQRSRPGRRKTRPAWS